MTPTNRPAQPALHPVVAALVGTDEQWIDILRKADDGKDPIVHAMRCLREARSGQFPREEAFALAEKAFPPPRGTDPDFYAFFLYFWAYTSLNQAEGRVILNIAEAMISKNRTPLGIRAMILYAKSVLSQTDRVAASRQALSLSPPDSPMYWRGLHVYLGSLAEIGRLSEAKEQCRLYERLIRERKSSSDTGAGAPVYFVNAVEAGRVEEALQLENQVLQVLAVPQTAIHERTWLATRILGLRLLQGQRMHDKTLLPDGSPEANYLLWPAAITYLLEREPEEALRWAREWEEADPGYSCSYPATFIYLTLLRAELATGNASAARRILEARVAKSGSHYLDDLFLARIALLEGNRAAAARHFAAVRAACRFYGAEGRLDFELRMACELSPADIMELSSEPVPEKAPSAPVIAALPSGADELKGVARLVGPSRALAAVRKAIRGAAPHDTPVLITGETGTGKELVARAIHEESPRRGEPFVTVDCGTISENLLESELFGHEKGAYTGADRAMPGMFREAGGGTIFLDEIGEIGPRLQGALLRVLESGEIRPVGASKSRKVDCRVIAATNAPLAASVEAGKFRKDLFYRLERLLIHVPPLSERKEDIAPLAVHFLSTGRKAGKNASLTPALEQALRERPWPGNVRELRNAMERLRLLNSDKLHYDLPDLPPASTPPTAKEEPAAQPVKAPTAGTTPQAEAQPPATQDGADESLLEAGRSPMRRQQRLRELFARHSRLTTAEVRKLLGVSSPTATDYLKKLCAEGCIEKVRPTPSPRSHYYRAKGAGSIKDGLLGTGSPKGSPEILQGSHKSSQRILSLVAEQPGATIEELATAIHISPRAVKKHLRKLKAGGRLKRVGPRKGGHWEVVEIAPI